jgi:chemotaxis protein histidine kinase CheA
MNQQTQPPIHVLKHHIQQAVDEALEAVARANDAHAGGLPNFAAAEVMSAHSHLAWVMQQLQEHAAELEQVENRQHHQQNQQHQQPGQQGASMAAAGATTGDYAKRLLQQLQQLDRPQQPQQAQAATPQELPAADAQPAAGASQPTEGTAVTPPETRIQHVLSGLQSMCDHLVNLAEQLAACSERVPPSEQQLQQLSPGTPQQPPGLIVAAADDDDGAAAGRPQQQYVHHPGNGHPAAVRLRPAAGLAAGAAARGLLSATDDTDGEPEVSSNVRIG